MSNNVISALEEQFSKDCKVINIRYEYEGFSGTERYIIASCLTEKEIWNKYPKQAKLYAPFVKVDLSFIEVRQKYINNEDKFCKRAKRTQDIFNFDETTAVFHKELLVNDFVLERINEEEECEVLSTLYKAFDRNNICHNDKTSPSKHIKGSCRCCRKGFNINKSCNSRQNAKADRKIQGGIS